MSEEFTNLENHMQGTNLALSAVAEVLAKMDERLTKEEEDDRMEEEEKALEAEKSDLVKAVASEVVSMIKAEGGENPLGMDVDGAKERKAKSITQPQYDDAQNAANPTTNIEDQQATIQAADMDDDDDEKKAMTKNHIPGHNSDDDEKKAMKMKFKAEDDEDDNGSDEKPVDKADDDDETDDDGMKAMRKELDALRKTVAAYEANMEKSIEEQSESRLRKMGFREENGLQRPSLLNQEQALGTDGTTPIVKANASSGDVVEDLSGLSYKQLRNLQHKIDSGDTTGVPRELLGNQ
jgi:hypothetical protein|tara:strand:- start:14247 stop:15128 length:882 start_codon:yes stop_codon:yes gene_type:complete